MCESDRLRAICSSVVHALQPIIRSYDVTEDELHAAARYLNRIGDAGVFASLLDIAFAMTIIDRRREGVPGTRANLEGPEYLPNAPHRPDGRLVTHNVDSNVPRLVLSGRITDARTGEAIPCAELDIWHADEKGGYDRDGFHLRGVIKAAPDGTYEVQTLLPTDYAEHQGDPIGELLEMMGRHSYRAAHIHFKVVVNGRVWLTSQVFRGDSPYLDSDYVIGAVSDDLVLQFERATTEPGVELYRATFHISVAPPDAGNGHG